MTISCSMKRKKLLRTSTTASKSNTISSSLIRSIPTVDVAVNMLTMPSEIMVNRTITCSIFNVSSASSCKPIRYRFPRRPASETHNVYIFQLLGLSGQCRIKVGAIDAAALVPFVKNTNQVDGNYFLYWSVLNAENKIVPLYKNGNGVQKSVQKTCNQWCPPLAIHGNQISLVIKAVSINTFRPQTVPY